MFEKDVISCYSTCGSRSTRCTAGCPGWWRPSGDQPGHSRSTARSPADTGCAAGWFPLGCCAPEAHWLSRYCWWTERLSCLDASCGTYTKIVFVRITKHNTIYISGFLVSLNKQFNSILQSRLCCSDDMWLYLCYNDYLDVVRVWTLSVGWGDARLDCLNPRLPQFLRLSLKHTAPAE